MKRLSFSETELLAEKFRYQMGLSLTEPINAKTLLRKQNITAVYRPMSEKSYGISCKSPNGKMFILINSNSTRGRQHFTIAHEFYHLHFDENPTPHMCNGTATGEEKNANMFASALLMPKASLLKIVSDEEIGNHDVNMATILRLEQLFGTSRSTLLFRLREINLITQKRLEDLKAVSVKDSAREYGYDLSLYEPGNEGLVIGDFGEKARTLFEKGIISEGHYEELLNMITDDRSKDKNRS